MSQPPPAPSRLAATDRLAVALSGICLVHCLLGPVLLAVSPALALLVDHETFHWWMLALVLPAAAVGLGHGARRYRRLDLLATGMVGLFLVVLGVVLGDLFGHPRLETASTVAGSCVLIVAHWRNYLRVRSCQAAVIAAPGTEQKADQPPRCHGTAIPRTGREARMSASQPS